VGKKKRNREKVEEKKVGEKKRNRGKEGET
jgi:hypothetical protein